MTQSVRVKICGITSVADAQAAVAAGADAIGLVFYRNSPRAVSVAQAAEIARSVGPFVTVVGLFVNEGSDAVFDILQQVPLHVLQFHGDEDEDYCRQFQRPYLKALRMKEGLDVSATMAKFTSAVGILLDAYRPGVPGGTGDTFDWQRVPGESLVPVVLAGGLTPKNVGQAIAATKIYGVDVSGGVEASPGQKDTDKMMAFVRHAKAEKSSE
ncbi:phosphoribosylanthranilate isomerase [Aestuariicella hydrocarbonica]|uniref:N-(5'-phosphoribosyl)anthranilate isomerase n=1 Tax=Pseudomaricurvus hydrocarbonicus TaxID=1470433 RepID=A0A9E5JPT4_9GAMM|nr:phosphoribosylanthranilate isomerase [Aestuariicella hydrocarbonica]NHO64392.1 phosphoribosylanthranilate isomerase [Aestuariicella hydrocarbonica]